MKKKLRIAVIGVGHLGQHHARILSRMLDIELVAIVDVDQKRVDAIAREYHSTSYTDYHKIFGLVDAVTIAVPTPLHYQIGKDFLSRGIHCLIEKPVTTLLEEAEELEQISQEKMLVLQVGHIERFNPAVMEAAKHVTNPKYIEARRLGPYVTRATTAGVVLDLMIHDLDIILALVNSEIKELDAIGTKILSDYEDIANARMKFANGCVADVSASRVSMDKLRKIRIFQPDSYMSLDYADKKLKIYRKKTDKVNSFDDIEIIHPRLEESDALEKELAHFIHCVSEGKKPLVSGQHGRDALELALEILKKIHGQ